MDGSSTSAIRLTSFLRLSRDRAGFYLLHVGLPENSGAFVHNNASPAETPHSAVHQQTGLQYKQGAERDAPDNWDCRFL